MFIVPAKTFDNVDGPFPIGFQIWDTSIKKEFQEITADVYDAKENLIGKKKIYAYNNGSLIIDWLHQYDEELKRKNYKMTFIALGYLRFLGTDYQNNKGVFWTLSPSANDLKEVKGRAFDFRYFKFFTVYYSVRHCMSQNWINDRDQFLLPKDSWEQDETFTSDCLVYSIFHDQNYISGKKEINHFIPYKEEEVNAKESFRSHFLTEYMRGLIRMENIGIPAKNADNSEEKDLFEDGVTIITEDIHFEPLVFSEAAKGVLDAGRELWCYYHMQPNVDVDASFYDIRLFFQGTHKNNRGKDVMNTDSEDKNYMELLKVLRFRMKELAQQIAPKIYEHGFLKRNYDPLNQQNVRIQHPKVIFPPMDEEAEVPLNEDGSRLKGFNINESKNGSSAFPVGRTSLSHFSPAL